MRCAPLIAAALLAACAEPKITGGLVPVAQITVHASADTVFVGSQIAVAASLQDPGGRPLFDRPVAWTSRNPTVAAVNDSGMVTAVSQGDATIVGSIEGLRDSASLRVLTPVARVVLPDTIRVALDRSVADTAVLYDQGGTRVTGRVLTWAATDTSIASVTQAGILHGSNPGTTQLIAQSGGHADTATVVVFRWVAAIQVTPESVSVDLGSTVQFHALAVDSRGDSMPATITWKVPVGMGNADSNGTVRVLRVGAQAVGAASGAATGRAVVVGWFGAVTDLAGNSARACALATGGLPICWTSTSDAAVVDSLLPASLAPHGYGGPSGGYNCGLQGGGVPWCFPGILPASNPALTAISGGPAHVCGIQNDQTAWCLGAGGDGELGNGTFNSSATFVPVSGGHLFQTVAAGNYYTCGLDTGGAAWCWGYGGALALGDSSVAYMATPAAVRGGHTFTDLAAGSATTCALDSGGAPWCWGNNNSFQLGTTDTGVGICSGLLCSPVPVQVNSAATFIAVRVGYGNVCGLTASGQAWCWGNRSPTPVQVSGALAFTRLALVQNTFCGSTASGAVYCGFGGTASRYPWQR